MSSDPHSPDTTDQQLAQRAQREWRHIFDAIGHPTVILDPDHCIIAANRAVQRAAGKSEDELLGKKCYEVFHSPDAAGPAEGCPMEKMLGSGRLEAVDMEIEAFGGWYMVSCTPVLDEAGRLERIIHIAIEITARKQIEESLRQSEARYRELFDHMSSGVAVYEAVDEGADFVFRDSNKAGERIDQTSRADVIGRRVTEAFPGVREFGLFEVFQRVWKTGTPEHFPVALYKDKRITGWRDNFVYKLPSGEVVAVYDDVTKRKQAEERLEHINAVLRAVRDVNQLIARETDRERLLRGICDNLVVTRGYVAAWAVLLDEAGGVGLAFGSGLGGSFERLVERAKGGALPPCVTTTLEQPGVHVFAAPHNECDDCPMKAIWSKNSVVSTCLAHGSRVYGILAVCMPPDYASDAEEQGLFAEVANDIAYALRQIEIGEERQRAEAALARQAEELARSNAELQQFAYVASHDLQEPLRKVTSYLQLLEERYKGRLDAGADEFIGFAVDGAQRMKRLISDLLEYSRVGTRGTPFEATDTGALLDRVLRDLQVTLSESLAHVTHDPLPTVMADSVQLSQVFQNMITNAVKFRREEPPRIHISAEQRGQEWVFALRDNGIGIDPELADRIFVMFQRLHGRGKYPGTGIGLAICKKIIERHGGRIWVESEPGRGSTFYFSLLAIEGERL